MREKVVHDELIAAIELKEADDTEADQRQSAI